MIINVNHQPKEITKTTDLGNLLLALQISTNGIAVAVNNKIITKSLWEATQLSENDEVTIIQATQGG